MQSATLVSVNEYLSASYRPDREYVDGCILERTLGEKDHSRLQMRLAAYLFNREKQWGIQAFPEQRVQVSPQRFRVPDICVVAGAPPDEQIFCRPPFICIEILSKDDRLEQMQERVDDYLRFGVPYVWILNPRTRKAYVCTPGTVTEALHAVLATVDPAISIPLAEVFE